MTFKKLATIVTSLAFALGLVLLPAAPASAALFSGSRDAACNGVNLDSSADNTSTTNSTHASCGSPASATIDTWIVDAINIFSAIIAVIAVVMIMVGGIRFITSGGDPANVTSARNTVLYAIIGLVVAALAQIIVRFVVLKTLHAIKK